MANSVRASTGVNARERRVIVGGATVAIVGLFLAYAILPFGRQWSAREQQLRAIRAESDTLAGLVASASQLESAAATQEKSLAMNTRRVLHARSATLAASSLQSLLQDASDASHLVVTRLDVAQDVSQQAPPGPSPDSSADTTSRVGTGRSASLPATLTAYCDVVGLAALLDHLARAPRVVYVERLTVQQNSSLRGAPDMLQVTLALRAPVVLE